MKNRYKSVIRIVLLVVLAALVGISIYSVNARMVGGNAMPMPFGFGMTVVLSGSMEPELSVDDLLIVAAQDSYHLNDIVVFQTQRTAVVHRIVKMEGDQIITRGDANSADDEPITLANIKGKVVLAIPFVGYLVHLIKTPLGTLLLLGLAFWLLEASFKKDKAQKNDELDAIRQEIEALKRGEVPPPKLEPQAEEQQKDEPKEEPQQPTKEPDN